MSDERELTVTADTLVLAWRALYLHIGMRPYQFLRSRHETETLSGEFAPAYVTVRLLDDDA